MQLKGAAQGLQVALHSRWWTSHAISRSLPSNSGVWARQAEDPPAAADEWFA